MLQEFESHRSFLQKYKKYFVLPCCPSAVKFRDLMPLISRAKATEAQQQLTFLHPLEKSYFYTYSRYSDDLEELGFEQAALVTDGGNANYRIEVVEAGENGFKAQAVSVVDFDKDGVFNVWEIDQDKNLKETVKD